MSNRADRRANKKSKVPGYHRLTKEQRYMGMVQNGITPKDLDRKYDEGYTAGRMEVATPVFKTIYAAICLALNDLHGFGEKRCFDVLCRVDDLVTNYFTSTEAVQDVFDRMGLELSFGDVYGTVRRKANGKEN